MNQMESTVKQQKQSSDHCSSKLNEDLALRKHKSQVLAKYSEISDEEIDYDNEDEKNDNGLFQNTNAQSIEDREKKTREVQHEVKEKIYMFIICI